LKDRKEDGIISFTVDQYYIGAWFVVGFFVFHFPQIKGTAESLDKILDIIIIISLFSLNFKTGMAGLFNLLGNTLIGYLAYKVGSNIGRNIKMQITFDMAFLIRVVGYVMGAYIVYSFFSNL